MAPLGIGIVGTGNIAGPYAADIATYPHLRLVAVADLDPRRALAFAAEHGVRAVPTLDALLADRGIDIVVNLTVHHAHFEVTKRALEAGRHVYSEKPLALATADALELVALARDRGVRLAGSPSTFLGEAQQTAAALVRGGRLGAVRAVYAEVNWGRIERWHPAPEPFYAVGVLFDVGVYPLTLVTTMLGPARRISARGWELMPDRLTVEGRPFRIGSPDLIVATVELEGGAVLRLTASFFVGRPARLRGSIEFHGDAASLILGSFQDFDAPVELGPSDGEYTPVPLVRPAPPRIAWGRGVAELAEAIEAGRPHRASAEQAAHVVEILNAAQASIARDGAPVEVRSSFDPPPLMPWAAAGIAEVETAGDR
jgi:predicted dehydrogenase